MDWINWLWSSRNIALNSIKSSVSSLTWKASVNDQIEASKDQLMKVIPKTQIPNEEVSKFTWKWNNLNLSA